MFEHHLQLLSLYQSLHIFPNLLLKTHRNAVILAQFIVANDCSMWYSKGKIGGVIQKWQTIQGICDIINSIKQNLWRYAVAMIETERLLLRPFLEKDAE